MVHDPVMLPKRCSQEIKMLGAPRVGVTLVEWVREAGGSGDRREVQCKQKDSLPCFRLTFALRAVGQKTIAGGRAPYRRPAEHARRVL